MHEVRIMHPEERDIIRSWRKYDGNGVYPVQDFVYQWYRYRNWESNPPAVAIVEGQVVGFHGFTITKTGYLNSMFQFVLPEHRGKGLAGAMVEFVLLQGLAKGAMRMRMRCPIGRDGDVFWQGFGLKPFGCTEKETFYDFPLTDVTCLKDLIAHADQLCQDRTFKPYYTTLYFKKYGISPIGGAWHSVGNI